MTEEEFFRRKKEEKLFYGDDEIVVGTGLIQKHNGKYVIGCSPITKDGKWHLFGSFKDEPEGPTEYDSDVKYVYLVDTIDNKGKARKVPVPHGISVFKEFYDTKEEALDVLYTFIKDYMTKRNDEK